MTTVEFATFAWGTTCLIIIVSVTCIFGGDWLESLRRFADSRRRRKLSSPLALPQVPPPSPPPGKRPIGRIGDQPVYLDPELFSPVLPGPYMGRISKAIRTGFEGREGPILPASAVEASIKTIPLRPFKCEWCGAANDEGHATCTGCQASHPDIGDAVMVRRENMPRQGRTIMLVRGIKPEVFEEAIRMWSNPDSGILVLFTKNPEASIEFVEVPE